MTGPVLLLATRNQDKLREIREILGEAVADRIVNLADLGVPENPEEDALEAFESFEENALAKARYFADLTAFPTLADDSGLEVDRLAGAPGVRSKRYSARTDLHGRELDASNNQTLLDRLGDTPLAERTARYVCVLAFATPDRLEWTIRGECEGIILPEPRGEGGFGYDPLFFLPDEQRTFGELPRARKNLISHRARAVRAAANRIQLLLSAPAG